MPIAAKRTFSVSIEVGTVIDTVRTAEAGFIPGAAVIVGQIHRFSIWCRQVEAAVSAEFVKDRSLYVVIIRFGRIGTALAKDEAQAADAAVVAVEMDVLAASCREIFAI